MFDSGDPQRKALVNGQLVLPGEVVTGGVVLEGDTIGEVVVGPGVPERARTEIIDLDGAFLIPGIVDLHNDSLELEVNPRPDTGLPLDFALANLEARLLAAGVTTEFHAIAFMNMARSGRTVAHADQRAEFLAGAERLAGRPVEHHVLHRLDVWNPEGADLLFESIQRFGVRYLSINDHTPGQGQYRDVDKHLERMAAWIAQRGGKRPTAQDIRTQMASRNADTASVPTMYQRIREERQKHGIIVATHDDHTPEKVDAQWAIGATVAEFPITVESARRARERGMTIIVGAPNIVRGQSSSGNQDARELFALGLADVICADYHAPSLLPAAFRLVDEGLGDLPTAVRTLTLNAARAVGLADRGAIAPGYRADLVVLQREPRGLPAVEAVFKAGVEVFRLAPRRIATGVA